MKRYFQHHPKKVWLVGMGPSCYDIFPPLLTQEATPDLYDEIWAVNMAANIFQHDLVFWMDDLNEQEKFKPGLISLLRRRGKPVITSKSYPDIVPESYDYPLDEVTALCMDIFGKPYMTNSIAQAIGYAMHIGVETLRIYGADFTYPNRDYAESGRACVEAWITLAHTRKMRVEISGNSSLFDAVADKGIYGYREQPMVTLPDGTQCKFTAMQPQSMGDPSLSAYTPTPGDTNAIPGRISGADGTGSPHPRDAAAGADSVESAEPPAVAGSGAGLRDRRAEGWDQGPDFAGADQRGAERRLPAAGQIALSPGEGGAGPGQGPATAEFAGPGPDRGNGRLSPGQ